jgi:hypothetical protein
MLLKLIKEHIKRIYHDCLNTSMTADNFRNFSQVDRSASGSALISLVSKLNFPLKFTVFFNTYQKIISEELILLCKLILYCNINYDLKWTCHRDLTILQF